MHYSIKTHEDEYWEYGKTYDKKTNEFLTDYMRLKKFYPPYEKKDIKKQ